jgi:LacI family transcriptional regulator
MNQITMKDIAKRAGISRPNISKILNNKPVMVSEETRNRVLQIAQELDYRPNRLAQSLKTGKTYKIGLMGSESIVDLRLYCFIKTAEGVESVFSSTDIKYSLVMFGANFQDGIEKSHELIEQRMVDGLIFLVLSIALERFNQVIVPIVRKLDIPFVVVHSLSKELPYNNVGMDSSQAGFLAAEHFINLGYHDIGMYRQYDYGNLQTNEIAQGFKRAFQARNLEWHDSMILESPRMGLFPFVPYTDAYDTIIALKKLPQAVFFNSDAGAYGALAACEKRGIRVPEEFAIIGLDDEVIPYYPVRLSSIHHPFEEKGREAVTMLSEILDGKRDSKSIHRKVIQPHLVVRETCGGAKPATIKLWF